MEYQGRLADVHHGALWRIDTYGLLHQTGGISLKGAIVTSEFQAIVDSGTSFVCLIPLHSNHVI